MKRTRKKLDENLTFWLSWSFQNIWFSLLDQSSVTPVHGQLLHRWRISNWKLSGLSPSTNNNGVSLPSIAALLCPGDDEYCWVFRPIIEATCVTTQQPPATDFGLETGGLWITWWDWSLWTAGTGQSAEYHCTIRHWLLSLPLPLSAR